MKRIGKSSQAGVRADRLPLSQTTPSYRSFVRQKIAAGLADVRAGRVYPHESIRREFVR